MRLNCQLGEGEIGLDSDELSPDQFITVGVVL